MVEEKTLKEFCRKLTEQKKEYLHAQALTKVRETCEALTAANTTLILHSAIRHFMQELFYTAFATTAARLLTPLHNTASAHCRALRKVVSSVNIECGETPFNENGYAEHSELLLIDTAADFKSSSAISLTIPPKAGLVALFSHGEKRVKFITDHYTAQLVVCIDNATGELTRFNDTLIAEAFRKFSLQLTADYRVIYDYVKTLSDEKEKVYGQALEKAAPNLQALSSLIRDFEGVRKLIF
jgi:hypothetical protein